MPLDVGGFHTNEDVSKAKVEVANGAACVVGQQHRRSEARIAKPAGGPRIVQVESDPLQNVLVKSLREMCREQLGAHPCKQAWCAHDCLEKVVRDPPAAPARRSSDLGG